MAGLRGEQRRIEKPWEMKNPRATVRVGPVIQIHWRSPCWRPSTPVCVRDAYVETLHEEYKGSNAMSY
jgi:hypothetical protein